MNQVGRTFREESVRRLRDEYVPHLRKAVETLPDGDLWWRPHDGANSVGNLLLHLEGNVRQWILSGLGGLPDHRHRPAEFAAREGASKGDLMADLEACVGEACGVIASLDDAALAGRCRIQGFDTTGLGAVYHVVEHFGWHVGQAVWITKLRAGKDHGIAFYDEDRVNRARNA